jgi:hypothetical protein
MLIAKLKTTAGFALGFILISAVAGGLVYPGDGPAGGAAQRAGAAPADPTAVAQKTTEEVRRGEDAPRKVTRHGVVLRVTNDLVQTSLGSDVGIARGDRLEIYRLKPQPRYVGQLKVIELAQQSSVGRLGVTGVPTKAKPQAGDLVAIDLFIGAAPPSAVTPQRASQPASKRPTISNAPPQEGNGDAAQQPDRTGTVTKLSETDLVQISLGSDDGIAKGDQVMIYRLKPKPRFVSRATVMETAPHSSVVSSRTRPEVGDLVTKQPIVAQKQATKQEEPPPAEQLGVVSRIDATNNVVEVSLGSDDGIKEGEVLHVWHLLPKAAYFGKIKVLATFRRSAVARPTNAAILKSITAGDKVSVHPPTMPSEPRDSVLQPRKGNGLPAGPTAGMSAHQVAGRFVAAAMAGKTDTIRGLLRSPLPKDVHDALLDAKIRAPHVALVVVDTDDAFAISNTLPAGRRVVMHLRRATLDDVTAGWLSGDWLMNAVRVEDADDALHSLTNFLNRHIDARVGFANRMLDTGSKQP